MKINWRKVEDELPPYSKPVLVKCGNSPYKYDLLKITVASYCCAKELSETMEEIDSHDLHEFEDSWVAEVSLFDPDYGGRLLNEDVTEWAYLAEE